MERWVGKVAVVTGASAGIGAAIAVSLANKGMIVIGLSRRINPVEELKAKIIGSSGQIHAYECDVTQADAVQKAFDWIENKFGGVNVLVNNAGAGCNKTILEDDSIKELENVVNLNFMGVIYCTKAAYKILTKTGDIGHIVNISSILGHKVLNYDANFKLASNVYPGMKHALKVTTEVMRQELRVSSNKNIKISMISPGLVRTEFFDASGGEKKLALFDSLPYLIPEDIADVCLNIIGTPPRVQIHDVIVQPAGEMF